MVVTSTNIRKHTIAEVELIYKSTVKPSQRPKVTSSRHAYEVLLESWDIGKIEFIEQFKILLMNNANRVLGIYEVSTGGVAGTIADPKVIFSAALKANASGIILAHNHPSGNIKPSTTDVGQTSKIINGGEVLEIRILDHLIVTPDGYYSFKDEGLI